MNSKRFFGRWLWSVVLLMVAANGRIEPLFGIGQPPMQPDNPQTTPGVNAAEGERLAKEVVARLDQTYYRLWQDQVNGFDAIYDVNEDGQNLGTVQIVFNPAAADGTVFKTKLQGESPNATLLEAMLGTAWLESLEKEFSDAKTKATRIGDSFTLFAKEPQEGVSSLTSTVSADYCLLHQYEAMTDLSSTKLEFKVQTLDGKHFVESLRWQRTMAGPGASGQLFADFTFTYARQEGVPFISKLLIDFTSHIGQAEGDHKWVLDLQRVTFQKGTPTDAGRGAGDAPERPKKPSKMATQWDELSQEVIAGICRSNIDFGAMPTFARSLSCDIDVRITSNLFQPATGTLNYWWQDEDDNGLLIGDEIQIEIAYVSNPAMRVMMQAIQRSLVMQTATAGANIFRDHFIKTVRIAEGYKMKLVPTTKDKPINPDAKNDKDNLIANRGYDALYLTVSPDFRVQRMRAVNEGADTEMVMNAEHEKIAGLWAASKYYREVVRTGKSVSTENIRCEYTMTNGFPTMKKLTIAVAMLTGQNTVSMKQEYTVRDCKIAWRDKPLDFSKFVGGEDDEALFKDKPKKPAVDEDADLFK